MSRQLISSEKFPTKPHNCPATKVPGLVFCAGQTATGEIGQATVGLQKPNWILLDPCCLLTRFSGEGFAKSEGGP